MGKLSQIVGDLNEADHLRGLLDDSEKALVRLDSQSAKELMVGNEQSHRILDSLSAAGGNIRAEAARLATVDERIIKNAGSIVHALGGKKTLVQLRQQTAPETTEPWWLLDQFLAQSRRRLAQRTAILTGLVAIIAIIAYFTRSIYLPILLPPDPVGDAVNAAGRALLQNDLPAAETAINTGLNEMPTNTELLIWKGILQDRKGEPSAATATFQTAMTTGTDKDFYLLRAITYVRLGDYAPVITDTTTIIQKYPSDPDAYYVRATGYEGLGRKSDALADLQQCSDLAQANGNDALVAQARMRMANLMQQSQ